MSNEYHFITHWRVKGTAQDAYDLIANPLDYPRWWPSVYLETTLLAPPDECNQRRRIHYHTKGWLPYTLRWESSAVETDRPRRIVIRALGDFDGRGIWTFVQDGEFVKVTFDWQLNADKPLLRYLSFLLKPAFSANHVWAMARGQESLQLELDRRQASSPEMRRRIPAPPGPNQMSGLWLSLAGLAAMGMIILLFRMATRH